jgi:hypothetical protein
MDYKNMVDVDMAYRLADSNSADNDMVDNLSNFSV